jgi:hypothetical protein
MKTMALASKFYNLLQQATTIYGLIFFLPNGLNMLISFFYGLPWFNSVALPEDI